MRFFVVLFLAIQLYWAALPAAQVNPLGPDVQAGPAVVPGNNPAASGPIGVVGKTEVPTEPVSVYVQPRFGIVTLTTSGKETVEAGGVAWQWPTPTLTMPAPSELLGGHAPAWRALHPGGAAAVPGATSVDLIGSAGKQTIPAATLAWHRTSFSDPEKLRKLILDLNARDAASQGQPIQFYFHPLELGVINPKAGANETALYRDCFVAVEARPILCGGGFEATPVFIQNQPVKEVQARAWLDCGFAEPVQEGFTFTRVKRIKLQLPQRRRNFLGFLHWLNGDWLEIDPDPEVSKVPPLNSLDFASEKEFLAALQAIRVQFKEKRPHLTLVKLNQNLRDRVANTYHDLPADKE